MTNGESKINLTAEARWMMCRVSEVYAMWNFTELHFRLLSFDYTPRESTNENKHVSTGWCKVNKNTRFVCMCSIQFNKQNTKKKVRRRPTGRPTPPTNSLVRVRQTVWRMENNELKMSSCNVITRTASHFQAEAHDTASERTQQMWICTKVIIMDDEFVSHRVENELFTLLSAAIAAAKQHCLPNAFCMLYPSRIVSIQLAIEHRRLLESMSVDDDRGGMVATTTTTTSNNDTIMIPIMKIINKLCSKM